MSNTKSSESEQIYNYTHFLVIPLKIVGCWDWYPRPNREYQIIVNNVYLCMVLFVLCNLPMTLIVNLYTEWIDIMGSLEKIADGLPLLASVAIVAYFGTHKDQLYELVDYMNDNFKFYSAKGLTNITMRDSYIKAKNFAYVYTACTLFSVTMYVTLPVIVHFWTKQPLQLWVYMDVTRRPFFIIAFLRQALGQAFVGLAMGQLGVFFAANAILLCGQYDLLCCSLRNARYTALLRCGVSHAALATAHSDIVNDEKHNYIYSRSELKDSLFHYDGILNDRFRSKTMQFDIYNGLYDEATSSALRECARVSQVVKEYKVLFEGFVSPLLALRVVQVTLYLCTLLYAATLKFDMITVEYLGAVALDIFVYCYFGNQIILQADRVSTAAYHSAWHTMGPRPRRLLLNILLANRRPTIVRAGRFLPMDLHTFVVIIKTSFSYYTLLVNVNEKK
ncbi:putative odorant receptor 85e [Pectinophora gossypiella]|uniref:putative odorant receptor 85e n=1 Tax=Pectinophora gossypiella TaxID=13191 RepID=UPI00214E0A4F|nr:putative odorant receptor 85e [Pectinophora gossypiella]